ncbi:MAG: FHA domain-containing protein [bacterium]
MNYFDTIRSKASRLSTEIFVRASPGMYLLGSLPTDDADDPLRRSFTTVPAMTVDEIQAQLKEEKRRAAAAAAAGRFLCRVAKSDRNPWRGRISVGRAKNNDVIIDHPSVSKLHAHFLVPGRDSLTLDPPSALALTDAESKNGTRLNGTLLAAASEVEIRPGDRLQFGAVTCDVLTAESLHRILRTKYPSASA